MPKTYFINGGYIETNPPEPKTERDREECEEILHAKSRWVAGLTLMEILLRGRKNRDQTT